MSGEDCEAEARAEQKIHLTARHHAENFSTGNDRQKFVRLLLMLLKIFVISETVCAGVTKFTCSVSLSGLQSAGSTGVMDKLAMQL